LFSTVIKKLHDLKPENITRQSLAFTKLKLKNNKTLLNMVFGKWLKGIEVIEDVNQVLNDLQKSKKLSDFEYHEIKLIKNELTYLKELQKNSNMNIERAKEVLLLFISHTSVSIKASKASKLNILGLLETRALDFKRVIITSVNEGIMPAGKTFNSLIPQVLKLKYGMFGYAERDKIFSYHFYRLIQRAEEIFLIYSSNKEGVDRGEKSRFIYQLEIENQDLHTLVYPNTLNQIILSNTQKEFIKTPETLKRIEEISQKGFSPSSLEMYIKNPLEYYLQKILNINNEEDKHDYVSHKKIGLIFHEVLEEFYSPFIGKKLCDKELYKNLKKLKSILKKSFLKHHEDASYSKNKLIFEVIKNSIETFINNEISELKTNSEIMLVSLEKPIKAELMLSNKQTVFIKGIVDRVDIKNGRTRIVDYKTGAIEPNQLSVRDLNSICKMSSKSKAMQLMCYVWMYAKTNKAEKISPGIFSLRKLNKGFMKLNLNNSKLDYVSDEEIYTFENCLRSLVEEIMNPKIDFIDSVT
jgi:ATP-dependent helicase/DNAse subunit B